MSDSPETESERNEQLTTTRRNAAKWLVALGGAAAVGSVGVNALTGLPKSVVQDTGEMFVNGTHLVDEDGNRITVDALEAGSGKDMTVFPEKKGGGALTSKDATTLLLRFDESDFQSPTNVDGTAEGYVAYSKVCTHEGCLVSGRDGDDLLCPCHDSYFDPLKGATVLSGPAPSALPQLPVGVTSDSDHLIIATGGFDGPVGPQS